MMTKEERCRLALGYHRQHYNCGQSVLGAFRDLTGLTEEQCWGLGSGLGKNRDTLTGQNNGARQGVLLLEEVTVSLGGLEGIGRANDLKLRNRAEGSKVLNRLVGRAVLANTNAVMGQHKGQRYLH